MISELFTRYQFGAISWITPAHENLCATQRGPRILLPFREKESNRTMMEIRQNMASVSQIWWIVYAIFYFGLFCWKILSEKNV